MTRDEFLNARDFTVEQVDVPGIGVVHIRPVTVAGLKRVNEAGDELIRTGVMIAESLCDPNGTRLFTPADAEALLEHSQAALGAIIDAITRINGFDRNAVVDAEKNSESTISAYSSSG